MKPRVPNGVDRALKKDIANLSEIPELVRPAWVIVNNKREQCRAEENTAEWFVRIKEYLWAAATDAPVAVYDVLL